MTVTPEMVEAVALAMLNNHYEQSGLAPQSELGAFDQQYRIDARIAIDAYLAMSQASPPPQTDWLVRQLEAWPTRIDSEKTINVEYLMKAAAKQIAALTAMKGTGDEEAISLHKDDRDGD